MPPLYFSNVKLRNDVAVSGLQPDGDIGQQWERAFFGDLAHVHHPHPKFIGGAAFQSVNGGDEESAGNGRGIYQHHVSIDIAGSVVLCECVPIVAEALAGVGCVGVMAVGRAVAANGAVIEERF